MEEIVGSPEKMQAMCGDLGKQAEEIHTTYKTQLSMKELFSGAHRVKWQKLAGEELTRLVEETESVQVVYQQDKRVPPSHPST